MKESMLNQFRLTVLEKGYGVYGINVYQEGKGEISYQWRSDDKVCLYSGSKTFTSLAIGICQDEGLLKLSDTVLSFFPEYKAIASEYSDNIRIRDLLHMSSGKKVFYFSGEVEEMRTNDWAKLFFLDPMKCEAGAEFFYSNACTYMLSRIVEKVSGISLRDFLIPHLFTPLGIFNPQWHTCPGGHTLGANELYLTNKEFSKLGLVFLNGGVYEGKRIVSEAYIKAATTDIISNAAAGHDPGEGTKGYGYQLWLCSYKGAYRADGMYGQFCIVFPDKKAVVTVTSHEENNANDILRAIYKDIIPYLE
ncbi:serine hydrolase domain-containing protein [Candidatus Clostridium stratigraminis]|uniref:Serine hydrolase domain-containing protein n=1 Tax=Candidatus Clostridium stratigraminis TaxID=3381661 RepID=A0ABW8T3S2_9CLOT